MRKLKKLEYRRKRTIYPSILGNKDIAELLIKHGANVSSISYCGDTSLYKAARHGNLIQLSLNEYMEISTL